MHDSHDKDLHLIANEKTDKLWPLSTAHHSLGDMLVWLEVPFHPWCPSWRIIHVKWTNKMKQKGRFLVWLPRLEICSDLFRFQMTYVMCHCRLCFHKENQGILICYIELYLDHNDSSKPSHRLTNGPEPSKTIESDGSKIKNHWKTIGGNGQTAKKHSMVMVSSKTIENLQWLLQNHWNLQWFPKTIELVNGPLKSAFS